MQILSFLLEKTRTVSVAPGERGFHIFYQGLATAEIREKYQLPSSDPKDYGFLKNGADAEGIDDAANYGITMACMRTLGFTEEELDHIWEILAAILSLGNVEYKFDEDKNEVSIEEHLHDSVRRAAELIKLQEPEKMFTML